MTTPGRGTRGGRCRRKQDESKRGTGEITRWRGHEEKGREKFPRQRKRFLINNVEVEIRRWGLSGRVLRREAAGRVVGRRSARLMELCGRKSILWRC